MAWSELMMQLRSGELEAVYLSSDDTAGYYEPSKEIKEMLKAYFGDR